MAKLLVLGCREFWQGSDWCWNVFDFVIVSLSVAETLLDLLARSAMAHGASAVRVLRTLRLARILRGVRITRLFRYFSALRSLILSIMSTMGSLMRHGKRR